MWRDAMACGHLRKATVGRPKSRQTMLPTGKCRASGNIGHVPPWDRPCYECCVASPQLRAQQFHDARVLPHSAQFCRIHLHICSTSLNQLWPATATVFSSELVTTPPRFLTKDEAGTEPCSAAGAAFGDCGRGPATPRPLYRQRHAPWWVCACTPPCTTPSPRRTFAARRRLCVI